MLFSHAYGASQGMCHCVKLILKKEELVSYAHDNHNLHIQCVLCGAFLNNLLQFFVQGSSFLCEWKIVVWDPFMMLYNLSKCCKLFSFKRTWSAVSELRCGGLKLKGNDWLFQPLQDKQTHPHVPTIHLDLNCCCVNFESLFDYFVVNVSSYPQFSFICSIMLGNWYTSSTTAMYFTYLSYSGLHWSACMNQCHIDLALVGGVSAQTKVRSKLSH